MENEKNCIIIHGSPDSEENRSPEKRTYDKHWMPWIKEQLNSKGIPIKIPLMPIPWAAVYEEWKKEFEKYEINENTILVGHSAGTAFLVRWLGDSGKKVKKLILVAPWKILYGDYLKKDDKIAFYNYEINENVKNQVEDIIIFSSDDEEAVGKESAKLFQKSLNGELIELKSHGHYTLGDMGTEEFPELLNKILE